MSAPADLEPRVLAVIRHELRVHHRTLEAGTRLVDDLGADSLQVIRLTLVFEDTFGIEISDEEAATMRTVRDAVAAVERRLRARGAAGGVEASSAGWAGGDGAMGRGCAQ